MLSKESVLNYVNNDYLKNYYDIHFSSGQTSKTQPISENTKIILFGEAHDSPAHRRITAKVIETLALAFPLKILVELKKQGEFLFPSDHVQTIWLEINKEIQNWSIEGWDLSVPEIQTSRTTYAIKLLDKVYKDFLSLQMKLEQGNSFSKAELMAIKARLNQINQSYKMSGDEAANYSFQILMSMPLREDSMISALERNKFFNGIVVVIAGSNHVYTPWWGSGGGFEPVKLHKYLQSNNAIILDLKDKITNISTAFLPLSLLKQCEKDPEIKNFVASMYSSRFLESSKKRSYVDSIFPPSKKVRCCSKTVALSISSLLKAGSYLCYGGNALMTAFTCCKRKKEVHQR